MANHQRANHPATIAKHANKNGVIKMTTPVITFGNYVFCFDAEPEEESSESHFIDFCGWTAQQFARIKNYPFFCAKVSCWKYGEELSTDYLVACCYKTESAFYKTYMGDYFADMVRTCADETGDTELIARVDAWHAKLRAQNEKRIAVKLAKRAAKHANKNDSIKPEF